MLSAWRNGQIAPMHHRGYSVFGTDRRQIRRETVVRRGQPWSSWLVGLILEGRGSKGLGRPCAGLGLPVIPFANFGAQKNLGFPTFAKCPRIGEKACCLRFLDAG